MRETHYETVFGGVSPGDATTVPGWYRQANGAARGASVSFPAFTDTLGKITREFGAETREVYYYDDDREEYVEIPHRAAVVNPAWLGDGLDDAPRSSAAWTTASSEYKPVTAADAYAPLRDVAHDRGLGDAYGSVECYRVGGEAVFEVLFDDVRHEVRGTDRELVLGFETGYDHYGRSSLWATLCAYDTDTGAALRGLSERYTRAHRGKDVTDGLGEWFETMLERVEKLDDTLTQVVGEAREYEVPMSDVPLTVAEWYESQGFPASYADLAAERLTNHRTPTAFDLWLAMSDTITTEFDGKRGGSAIRGHATRVNDILYSPPSAERAALEHARSELRENEQTTLGGDDADELLTDRIETLDEGVEAFESVRERFRTMLREVDENDDEQGEQDEPTDTDADANEVAA